MVELATLVRRASESWEPGVERAVFGTGDPDTVAEAIEAFVEAHLGPVDGAIFYRPGVGIVAGLRLVTGAEIVVKVHRWNVTERRLVAVHEVQAFLSAHGVPAPRPVVGPEALARGIATVEEMMAAGTADGHDRPVGRSLATGLHTFVASAAKLTPPSGLGPPLLLRPAGAPLWHEPHDVRFDFEATRAGAEWIDHLATEARHRLDRAASLEVVVGHFDWRVENLGFDGSRIVAIYDWDSLALAPEAIVVGNAAAQFTSDWTKRDDRPLPSLDEMRTFVEDYEVARGCAFSGQEFELLDAANLFLCAYGSRCEHSDATLHPEIVRPISPWVRLLEERGERGLMTR